MQDKQATYMATGMAKDGNNVIIHQNMFLFTFMWELEPISAVNG